MTRLLCVLACLFLVALEPAKAAVQNPFGRAHVDLSGRWRVIVDPAEIGTRSPFEGFPPTALQKATPWRNDLVLQEWAFDERVTLAVPGDWNSQDPRLFFYEGDVWYARPITHAAKPGRRAVLHFGAVNHLADVYLNGAKIGSHAGGFTPFAFDVTDALKPGENMLVVRVNAMLDAKTIPTRATDWHNYGGITREVLLLDLPDVHVADYWVRLTDLARREVTATVRLSRAQAGVPVEVALPGLKERARGVTDARGEATLRWRTRGGLWAPGSPTLHAVRVTAGEDVVEDRIGLRTIAVAGEDILLNGRPIFLKGVSAHEETILRPGRAHSREDAAATLDLIADLGGNFIRLAHYPHSEHMLRLADERGVLVWAEQPIYWGIAFGDPAVLESAKRQTEAMVLRDRNRAAIVLWSIANETPLTAERLAFLQAVAAHVRSIDPSRPLTAALFGDPFRFAGALARIIAAQMILDPATPADRREALRAWAAGHPEAKNQTLDDALLKAWASETPRILIDDPLGAAIDVIGYNQYLGWYYEAPLSRIMPATESEIRARSLALMPRVEIRTKERKPLMISEFGADAKAGYRGNEDLIFTEDFQARYYRAQLAMIAPIPNLRGVSPWVLKDFRAPRRVLPGLQDGWNRKGLVDETGTRKLAFEVLAQAYRSGALERSMTEPRPARRR